MNNNYEEELLTIENIYSDSHNKHIRKRLNDKKKYKRHVKMSEQFGSYDVPIMIEKEKENKTYHVRRWLSHRKNSAASWLKKASNQKVRHYEELPLKGNTYKKVFDFWWEIS